MTVFIPNIEGYTQVRLSPAAFHLVETTAKRLATRAGRGYVATPAQAGVGRSPRARSIVYPREFPARWDNQRNNTLVKLIGGS